MSTRKHDPVTYRAVCTSLDRLFASHGETAGTSIRRYMRIRTESAQKEARISELEDELKGLKKVDDLSRKRA